MNRLPCFAAMSLLSLSSAFGGAQAQTVASGRTTVQFSSDFQESLSGFGATLTDLSMGSLVDGTSVFRITEGVLDPQTSAGELASRGGLIFATPGLVFQVQNLLVNSADPKEPVMTGVLVINGAVVGRMAIFDMAPLAWSGSGSEVGTMEATGISLSLSAAVAGAVNAQVGMPLLAPGIEVGTADVFAVFGREGGTI